MEQSTLVLLWMPYKQLTTNYKQHAINGVIYNFNVKNSLWGPQTFTISFLFERICRIFDIIACNQISYREKINFPCSFFLYMRIAIKFIISKLSRSNAKS